MMGKGVSASQYAALSPYAAAAAPRGATVSATVPYAAAPPVSISQAVMLAVYAPEQVPYVMNSQLYALVPYSTEVRSTPKDSQTVALVVWGPGVGGDNRSRAWTFVLDGHVFYVLDLGAEGTFLYDITTDHWCEFRTAGHTGWNMRNGVVWGDAGRIAGADSQDTLVWEMIPTAVLDDGFRSITHFVTGGLATRSRVYRSVDAVRISGSVGTLGDDADATFTMRFSDDNGNTWSDDFIVALTQGAFGDEVAWRSLGSFMAPGRVFEMEDVGGLIRIDGADVFIDGFDGEGG